MKHWHHLLTALAIVLLATSCNMEEGEGGTGTIIGQVWSVQHNDDNFDMSTDTTKAAKTDVYIVYGDQTFYGDKCETGENGQYQFRYLTPGDYTVYAYSTLATGERVAEKQHVELKRGETKEAADIFIHQGKAYGTSMIRGWVMATYFDKNGNQVRQNWAYDQRVYLKRIEEDYYCDDTRVGLDGIFYFQKLQPATYVIFTFGQNSDETPYPVHDTIVVGDAGAIYDADTLKIRLKA